MSCENKILMLNDYLDKTLSKNEERQVKHHLKECAFCRSEYHHLENADNALKQVICKMVAEVDVPLSLSERIEKIIAHEKRNTLRTRLSILLKTPAAVASLFFVVLVTGFLTFNSYFNPAKQPNVAFSDKDKGQYSGSAVLPAGNKAGAAVEEVGSLKERQLQQTDSVKNLNEQMNREPDNTVKEPAPDQPVIMAEILRDQLPAPADNAAPERLNKPRSVEEQRTAAVTSAPPDAGTGMAATNDEALEAAPRYMDFTPAKPDYLPRGSILVNISRLADEISQDYRTGDNYFTVSQSRLEADDFAFVEKTAQVANVKINGWQGFIEESRPKPGDHVSGAVTTLKWRQGEWAFSVSGDLPPEEIIRISASIK